MDGLLYFFITRIRANALTFFLNINIGEYDESSLKLTMKGKFASQLREVHCLAFAKLLEDKTMEHLTAKQLVSLFSIFTNINVQEECKR